MYKNVNNRFYDKKKLMILKLLSKFYKNTKDINSYMKGR